MFGFPWFESGQGQRPYFPEPEELWPRWSSVFSSRDAEVELFVSVVVLVGGRSLVS